MKRNDLEVSKQEKVEGFTFKGKEINISQVKCLAKRIVASTGREVHYILFSTKTGRMFNVNDDDWVEIARTNLLTGKNQFEFRKVNEDTFKHYMSFLKTNNEAHLRASERSL